MQMPTVAKVLHVVADDPLTILPAADAALVFPERKSRIVVERFEQDMVQQISRHGSASLFHLVVPALAARGDNL
jgi:hypothetical protein